MEARNDKYSSPDLDIRWRIHVDQDVERFHRVYYNSHRDLHDSPGDVSFEFSELFHTISMLVDNRLCYHKHKQCCYNFPREWNQSFQ